MVCALLGCLLTATTQARTFTRIGGSNGLEAQVVPSIIVDHKGFLWIGSREGLFRYDGYRAELFQPDHSSPTAISDTDIRYLYESTDGYIWVGTNTGGLNRYDPLTGEFQHFRHDSTDPASLPDDSVYGISEGPGGDLWVATQKGLGRLSGSTGRFERYRHESGNPQSLPHDWAFSLHLGQGNNFWVSTVGGGLSLWNPATASFTRFDLANLIGGPVELNDVFSAYESVDGRVWIGTRNGLIVLDPVNNTAEMVNLGEQGGYLPVITSIVADTSGRLWLSTMVRGILIVDMHSQQWHTAKSVPLGTKGYLPSQPQMCLTISHDTLFVGTWGSGVYRASLEESPFSLTNRQSVSGELRNEAISSVLASQDVGRPWVGSFGGGVQRLDIITQEVIEADEIFEPFKIAGVLDMVVSETGKNFAATTGGLYQFDENGQDIFHDRHDAANRDGLGEGYVNALAQADEDLWVGISGTGLYRRNQSTGVFKAYRHDAGNDTSLSGDSITALLIGADNNIWVGTRSNGLNFCKVDPWQCEQVSEKLENFSNLSEFSISALYRDRRGRVWVGTDGGGLTLVKVNESGQVTGFEHWGKLEGLLSDGIMAIEEDLDESLWLSTRKGLSRINPATGNIVNFVRESGLPVTHFNAKASSSDEAFVYFGSVGGLLSIPKGTLLKERTPAQVRITRVQRAARGEQTSLILNLEELLIVPFGEIVTVEFATLDYSEVGHEYAYRMQSDESWLELGSQRQIIFHGLPSGSYEFQVRGRDAYGMWNNSPVLKLEIVPPFWMTKWFRISLAIILAMLGVGLHRVRLRMQQRIANEIQRLSERREEALEQALGSDAELKVLTPRQKEILQLVAEGYPTREIAEMLNVSIKTVEAHRTNLMERLEIYDVPGLVRLAIRARLVSPHD